MSSGTLIATTPSEQPKVSTADPHQLFGHLKQKLACYLKPTQIREVRRSFNYAEPLHRGQLRKSGEPYIVHPLAVADILADMRLDEKTLTAAILHDLIEDTDTDKQNIRNLFGDTVAELVDGVSKLDKMENISPNELQSKNFHKMVMATARDVRVILVKLADRLHNMRTIKALPLKRRKQIARETLDFYAPIAMRLGMDDLRMNLEDLSFATLHPMRARRIRSAIDEQLHNRSDLFDAVRSKIVTTLKARRVRAKVVGRQKNLYSIYRKMTETRRVFKDIMDVFGFRIVVRDINTCYRTLGIIHQLYKPIQGKFKDYIALPKANGYQSLHSILFGPYGLRIEIQIRTHAMDQIASHGIAAHNFYKLGETGSDDPHNQRIRGWLKGLLELEYNDESGRFSENLRADLFPDDIYLFSPKGDITKLPRGATPVDFAYAVHTDIGNHCVGCLVDRKPAILSTSLENSQTIQIITSEDASPNPTWINFVTTEKARIHIRQHLRQRQRDEAISLGNQLLARSLASLDSSHEQITETERNKLLETCKLQDWDELLAEIGLGNRSAALTARKLLNEGSADRNSWWNLPRYFRVGTRHQPIPIIGTEGMILHFGHCCSPIPGDPLIGMFHPGRGLVVHIADCRQMNRSRKKGHDEAINLSWADSLEDDYTARLRVDVTLGRGVLAELAATANSCNANVEKLSLEEPDGGAGQVELHLGVQNRVHLAQIIRHIRRVKNVRRVSRIRN